MLTKTEVLDRFRASLDGLFEPVTILGKPVPYSQVAEAVDYTTFVDIFTKWCLVSGIDTDQLL